MPPVVKEAVYQQLARVGRSLASPRRLELLDLLAQSPRTVERLAEAAHLSVANASQHLRALAAARLVETRRDGVFVEYRLAGHDVADLCRALRLLAEARLAELDRLAGALASADDLEPVDPGELSRRLGHGDVTLLDVRPPEEFAAGHIAGALSVPLPELRRRLRELPKSREVVAYCRGPYCVMAVEAVRLLRRRGFRARRLEESITDWRARGLPVAVEAA